MSEIKWIKIVTDIFDDEKILLIEQMPEGDSLIVVWFKLLCLAGKQNNSGVFMINDKIPYTDEMFSSIFRRSLPIVRLALSTFEKFGMIEIVNNVVTIPNWGKHQSLDKIEKRNEYMREYMQEYRVKQLNKVNCKVNSKLNVNSLDKIRIEEDKNRIEKDKENLQDKPASTPKFIPPTLQDVTNYCKERKNDVDAERFINFYTSKGWLVGKSKMKDWKACVRTWEKPKESNGKADMQQRTYDNKTLDNLYTNVDEL